MNKLHMSDTIFEDTLVLGQDNEAPVSRTSRPGKTAHSAAGCEKIIVGTILGVLNSSEALVDHRYNASGAPLKARTVAFLSEDDLGRQAVLGFEEGDVSLPIILGTIKTTLGTIKTTETEPKHVTVEAAPPFLITHETDNFSSDRPSPVRYHDVTARQALRVARTVWRYR